MKAKILIVVVILFPYLTIAQKLNTVSGKLVSGQSDEPIEFATIQLKQIDGDFSKVEVSDQKGRFQFTNIPEGDYGLTYRFIGFETIETERIKIDKKTTKLGTIQLKPKNVELTETKITADRNSVDYKIDKQVINVSQQLHAKGGTAADALQVIPSVQVDAEGNVTLRGSSDFLLLIDGRPSIMETSEVLNQMQADNIENIEVITNPSAKYEAEGNTGIINIVTKKSYLKGTEGLINLMIANGNKYSGSLNLNKSFKNFRVYGGVSYSDRTKLNESWSERIVDNIATESIYSDRKLLQTSGNIKLGTDIYLNKKNTLSLEGKSGQWEFNRTMSSNYVNSQQNAVVNSYEIFAHKNAYFSGAVNFKHLFDSKDHSLVFDAFYNYLDNSVSSDYDEINPEFHQQVENRSVRANYRFKLDYTLPLNDNLKLESGLFYKLDLSDYNYHLGTRINGNSGWDFDPALVGTMDYYNANFAAYFIIMAKLKAFDFQIGLRAEGIERSLQAEEDDYKFSQIDLFPTVHFSKVFKEKHTFSLSYSRRINRPSEWQLNPELFSSDRFLLKRGNPELMDEFTNAVELNYFVRNKKFNLNMQLYAKDLQKPIASYLLYENESFIETYDNIDKTFNTGLELMLGYNPTKWLRLNTGVNSYYSSWNGQLDDGNDLEGSSLVMSGNFRSTFILSKSTYLQFLAIYYAPNDDPQGHMNAFYYFDFIVRQQFFEKKLSLTLRTHNTFDTGLLEYTIAGNNYNSDSWYRYEGPTFFLSLSYKLNNYKRQNSNNQLERDFDSGLDH